MRQAAMTIDEAIAEMRACAGTQFDPEVVQAFCDEFVRAGAKALAPHA